jgi:hypothetical protein
MCHQGDAAPSKSEGGPKLSAAVGLDFELTHVMREVPSELLYFPAVVQAMCRVASVPTEYELMRLPKFNGYRLCGTACCSLDSI